MWGLGPRHVRMLCDNVMEGGRGYRPEDVGNMTLDAIIMLLTERKLLRSRGRQRVTRTPVLQAKIGADGKARGRAADGTPIRARIGGKSMAQLVQERAQQAAKEETPRQRRARERAARAERRAARSK